jgi:hypothetical protein
MNLVNFITESEIYNGLGKDPLKHAKNFIIQATDIFKYFRTEYFHTYKYTILTNLKTVQTYYFVISVSVNIYLQCLIFVCTLIT